jgi:hypothetical protein
MTTPCESNTTVSRKLPLLYFLVGYVSLSLAFAAVAFAPRSVAGFYYHARLIAVVHLVTLGWITSVILGLVYIVLPAQLGSPLPVRRGDYWAFASFVIGLIGMVAHFWIQEFSGMAWSGLMAALAIVHVGVRAVSRARRSDASLRLPLVLAFGNAGLAATAGIVLGFDKVHHFLPGYVVANVLAHAHVAALGWAAMMTIGFVYLIARIDGVLDISNRSIMRTVMLLEVGTLGVGGALLLASRWAALFAAVALVAFARFIHDVARIRGRRVVAGLPRPFVAEWHVAEGCVCLAIAAPIGLALAWMDTSPLTLRLALVYGACGLLGFLAQCLMGIQMRLVPLAFDANADRPCAVPASIMWSVAVPLLALGFFFDSVRMLTVAGAAGCIATIATATQGVFVVGSTLREHQWLSWGRGHNRRRSTPDEHVIPQTRL